MPAGTAVSDRPAWGADEAVEQLYAAHWRQLVRLSVLLVRDTGSAEEIVQDAFVAVHGRWSKLRDPDLALAYLRQAVVNRSRSALRHRAVVERHAARERLPADVPGADESALISDRRAAVLDAMRVLPQRQREVLALRYYLDLSESEIADALGISRGAVKSHASRGSAALRELLADQLRDQPDTHPQPNGEEQ
jgi:RNA polymerase sigma-70 factor (sigma-E family)